MPKTSDSISFTLTKAVDDATAQELADHPWFAAGFRVTTQAGSVLFFVGAIVLSFVNPRWFLPAITVLWVVRMSSHWMAYLLMRGVARHASDEDVRLYAAGQLKSQLRTAAFVMVVSVAVLGALWASAYSGSIVY